MGWFRDWADAAKKIVLHPQHFLQHARSDDAGHALKFAATSFLVSGLISGVITLVAGSSLGMPYGRVVDAALTVVLSPVVGTVMIFISAGITHLFVYLLGGRGFSRTLSAFAYGTAIAALFGWIPLVNIAAGLYVIYVNIRGVEQFHGFSLGRAAVAVLILPLLLFLVAVVSAAWLWGSMLMMQQDALEAQTQQLRDSSAGQIDCSFADMDVLDATVTADGVQVSVTNTGTADLGTVSVTAFSDAEVAGTGQVDGLSPGAVETVGIQSDGPVTSVRAASAACPAVTAERQVQ